MGVAGAIQALPRPTEILTIPGDARERAVKRYSLPPDMKGAAVADPMEDTYLSGVELGRVVHATIFKLRWPEAILRMIANVHSSAQRQPTMLCASRCAFHNTVPTPVRHRPIRPLGLDGACAMCHK